MKHIILLTLMMVLANAGMIIGDLSSRSSGMAGANTAIAKEHSAKYQNYANYTNGKSVDYLAYHLRTESQENAIEDEEYEDYIYLTLNLLMFMDGTKDIALNISVAEKMHLYDDLNNRYINFSSYVPLNLTGKVTDEIYEGGGRLIVGIGASFFNTLGNKIDDEDGSSAVTYGLGVKAEVYRSFDHIVSVGFNYVGFSFDESLTQSSSFENINAISFGIAEQYILDTTGIITVSYDYDNESTTYFNEVENNFITHSVGAEFQNSDFGIRAGYYTTDSDVDTTANGITAGAEFFMWDPFSISFYGQKGERIKANTIYDVSKIGINVTMVF